MVWETSKKSSVQILPIPKTSLYNRSVNLSSDPKVTCLALIIFFNLTVFSLVEINEVLEGCYTQIVLGLNLGLTVSSLDFFSCGQSGIIHFRGLMWYFSRAICSNLPLGMYFSWPQHLTGCQRLAQRSRPFGKQNYCYVITCVQLETYVSFSVSSQNSLLNVFNNTLWLGNWDFYLEGKMESSRSKVINFMLQVSLANSMDEQLLEVALGATSVSVEGVLWIPGALVLWRAL